MVYSEVVTNEDYVGGGGQTDLFLRHLPGTTVDQLTNHRAHPNLDLGGAIEQPRLSPDGRRVLFLSNYESAPASERQMYTDAPPDPNTLLNIWLLDRATGTIRAVTRGDLGWQDVQWSPDGHFFSAVYPTRGGMLQDSPPCDVYVFDATSLQKHKVAHSFFAYERTAWRPDSRHLLVETRRDDTFLLDQVSCPDGGDVPLIAGIKNAGNYVVSPNGQYVTFADTYDGSLHFARLERCTARTVLQLRIPEVGASADWSRPLWSPGGGRLAVMEYNSKRLYLVDARKVVSTLLTTFTRADRAPINMIPLAWSRDGRWLIVRTDSQAEQGPLEEGLLAVSAQDGRSVLLAAPSPIPGGLDWHESW